MSSLKNITNERVTEYIETLYKPLTRALGELRLAAEAAGVPIIQRETEGLILSVLTAAKPATLLEIGAAVGYSSSCFAEAVPGLKVTTIEYDPGTAGKARENIESLGYSDRVEVITGDAREVLKSMADASFDVVFIDAAKGQYKVFFDEASRFFKKGTIIISDNVLMKGGTVSDEYDETGRFKTANRRMREYLSYINSFEEIRTSVISAGDGVAISILI